MKARMIFFHSLLIVIFCGILAMPIKSETVTTRYKTGMKASASTGGPPSIWVPIVKKSPVIDGKLDKDSWKNAPTLLLQPLIGRGRAGVLTEVRVMRDLKNLYLLYDLQEPSINKLRHKVKNADGSVWQDDCVEIFSLSFPR